MSDWNPALYLKFQKERTRPIYDLIDQIELDKPKRILDIGCGPGNSTIVLKNRWPMAEVIGLDYSEAMIKRAKQDYPTIEFMIGDANADLSYLGKFDIVFANASLQWLPEHEKLIPRLYNRVECEGIFASQIPQFHKMPMSLAIKNAAAMPQWNFYFSDFKDGLNFFGDTCYYDYLYSESSAITMWATEYYHVMDSYDNIIEMIKSTGLKPYLEKLPQNQILPFCEFVKEQVKPHYKERCDGKVLFPFKRFFFVAKHK